MDLGIRSRKMGIKARESLPKDEFSMENIDDFFTDDNISFFHYDNKDSGNNDKRLKTQQNTPGANPFNNNINLAPRQQKLPPQHSINGNNIFSSSQQIPLPPPAPQLYNIPVFAGSSSTQQQLPTNFQNQTRIIGEPKPQIFANTQNTLTSSQYSNPPTLLTGLDQTGSNLNTRVLDEWEEEEEEEEEGEEEEESQKTKKQEMRYQRNVHESNFVTDIDSYGQEVGSYTDQNPNNNDSNNGIYNEPDFNMEEPEQPTEELGEKLPKEMPSNLDVSYMNNLNREVDDISISLTPPRKKPKATDLYGTVPDLIDDNETGNDISEVHTSQNILVEDIREEESDDEDEDYDFDNDDTNELIPEPEEQDEDYEEEDYEEEEEEEELLKDIPQGSESNMEKNLTQRQSYANNTGAEDMAEFDSDSSLELNKRVDPRLSKENTSAARTNKNDDPDDEEFILGQQKEFESEEETSMERPLGLRRSTRIRVPTLDYWRNEKIVYKRNPEKPVLEIADVIRKDPDDDTDEEELMRKQRRKRNLLSNNNVSISGNNNSTSNGKRRGRPKKNMLNNRAEEVNKEILRQVNEGDFPNSKWIKYGLLESTVVKVTKDPGNQDVANAPATVEEDEIIAFAPNRAQTEEVEASDEDNFSLSVMFDKHKELFASGVLKLPIMHGKKAPTNSYNTALTFYVVQGILEVTLYENKFVCTAGSSFQIPAYNNYAFENKGYNEVKLFFVQVTVPDKPENIDISNNKGKNNSIPSIEQKDGKNTTDTFLESDKKKEENLFVQDDDSMEEKEKTSNSSSLSSI
ncbi:uncharacterized protein SCODWIG_03510 [Saccharomycodes ludwigii]|uniref:CENP-C homolog n=1 Tax=Saccharomycodes ludwigii TaxID=36035 RepID=A0A376BAY6_9ASCO|nr:uncharacterized protein SCODWIG_03510 [Saccharomycodes ludwigii]